MFVAMVVPILPYFLDIDDRLEYCLLAAEQLSINQPILE
jgi:hypothetical protein